MATQPLAESVSREIVRLCHAGLNGPTLTLAALGQLRKVVPVDGFWCASTDPATILFTGSVKEEIPEYATPAFLANEHLQDDVNKFARLARGGEPVNSLYEATGAEPAQSSRYRDILVGMGFGDELRAALTLDGTCWGVMCLHRELAGPAFTPAEIAFLRRLRPHLAHGLRTALLLHGGGGAASASAPAPADDGPGLLLLAEDLSLAAATPAAERWLNEIADHPSTGALPQSVLAVAARLQAIERTADSSPPLMPRTRVRARSGQWLVLHASRLVGPDAVGRIAVIVEVARPIEVAPLILEAYELTPREHELASCVLGGRSTAEIAAALCITQQTVQQHLKSVFDKVGVRSRREMVARIFARHYRPNLAVGAPVGADGFFAAETPGRT